MVHSLGGKVAQGEHREYGHAKIECINSFNNLFANVTDTKGLKIKIHLLKIISSNFK
jgi:GMP synthase-like glutamine amidotransferase